MIYRAIKDLIYPVLCYQCGELQEDGSYLCESCCDLFKRVGDEGEGFCARCSEPFEGRFSENPVCVNCSNLHYSFDFARSALKNSDHSRQLIHDFKYRKQRHLVGELSRFIVSSFDEDERLSEMLGKSKEQIVIVPVPLHWRRRLFRGFNQAELLSRALACELGLKHLDLLKRNRYTSTQTRLVRKERLKNLKDAFSIRKEKYKRLDFSRVILIDDVFTTGSTAEACSALIKKECAKVENIVVLTVLRG